MDFLDSVVLEAEVRDEGVPLTVEKYWAIRLEGVAVRSLYSLGELHLSLPDTVLFHPLISELTYIGCELIAIDNVCMAFPTPHPLVSSLEVVLIRTRIGHCLVQPRTSIRRRQLQHRHGRHATVLSRSGWRNRVAREAVRGT